MSGDGTGTETAESLRAEIERARARVAELTAAVASAEEEVHRLERIVEVVPGAVWESEGIPGDPNYRMPYVSGEVERIFGYTREECLQTPAFWMSIIHPDDMVSARRNLDAVAQTGGRLPELRFLTKDGRSIWVETHITLNRDASGTIIGRSVIAPDVTERVLAERAGAELLSRSQDLAERLDNIVASVPGLVWEVRGRLGSADEQPIFLSDHLETLVGHRPGDVFRQPHLWAALSHPDDEWRMEQELAEIYAAGGGTIQHRWLTRDSRTLWVESHVRVLVDETGAPVGALGVTMDITDRKLAEQERARLKEQVRTAQAGALAELSTPIIPISKEILVMPLIGAIDDARAGRIVEALLDGVSKARARVAILDISGVRSVDAHTVDAVLRAAGAATLLGAEVVLTGVRAEVAAALSTLDVHLGEITICGSLERGIAHATGRRR